MRKLVERVTVTEKYFEDPAASPEANAEPQAPPSPAVTVTPPTQVEQAFEGVDLQHDAVSDDSGRSCPCPPRRPSRSQ